MNAPKRTAVIFIATSMIGFGLIDSVPAISQTVALVKVDVTLVANGYRATKLVGTEVDNDKNENIGKLEDIIIGKDGRALFAIIDVGGFLSLGTHLVAVSYPALQINDANKKITLPGASRDELKKLAEFKYGSGVFSGR